MLNQSQSIRSFVDNKLADIVRWTAVQVDPASNGDRASVVMPVKGHKVRINVTSAYITAPLGEIIMTDLADGHEIRGAKADAVWATIESYIRRLATDAAIRGGPEPIDTWEASPPIEEQRPLPTYADPRKPYLGQGLTYHVERGEPMAGMMELAAIVTRVIDAYTLNLTIFPDLGEPFWRNHIGRRHEGKQFNCWEFSEAHSHPVLEKAAWMPITNAPVEFGEYKLGPPSPAAAALQAIVIDSSDPASPTINEAAQAVLTEIPVKRGPGRPRKNAA